VGAGTNFQIHVRRGNAHLAEENVGEFFVVVLAGVDEDGFDFRVTLHLVHERRDFREIGAGSDDIQDFQGLGHRAFVSKDRMQYSIEELGIRWPRLTFRLKKTPV